MILYKQIQTNKSKWLFLIVCFYFCIINLYPCIAKAENTNIAVSATVEEYLAVYVNNNGNVRAESNTINKYFVNKNICVINY